MSRSLEVPDETFKKLPISKSAKIVPAVVEFVGTRRACRRRQQGRGFGNKFLSMSDVILANLVSFFEDENVNHVANRIWSS